MHPLTKILLSSVTFLLLTFHAQAQSDLKSAMIGINGLTCSACTRTVEMSIRKLTFVKDVVMNLEHTNGKIIFKEGASVAPVKISKAVSDVGFSVRFIQLIIQFNDVTISDNYCYNSGTNTFQFINSGAKTLYGETTLKLLGESFWLSVR